MKVEPNVALQHLQWVIADLKLRILDLHSAPDERRDHQVDLLTRLSKAVDLTACQTLNGSTRESLAEARGASKRFPPLLGALVETFVDLDASQADAERLRAELAAYLQECTDLVARTGDEHARSSLLGPLSETLALLHAEALSEIVSDAEESRAELRETTLFATEAAGDIADHEIAASYDAQADRELRLANWFRASAIVLLIGAFGESLYFAVHSVEYSGTGLLARLAVALPLLALIAFLTRESSDHRHLAQAYRLTALQLKTVSAYCKRLGPDERQVLLKGLGEKVFAGSPIRTGPRRAEEHSRDESHTLTIEDLAALLLRASRG